MNKQTLCEAKLKLQRQFGSLRAAARDLSISSWRLSSILNGWIQPTREEAQKIGLYGNGGANA